MNLSFTFSTEYFYISWMKNTVLLYKFLFALLRSEEGNLTFFFVENVTRNACSIRETSNEAYESNQNGENNIITLLYWRNYDRQTNF